MKTAAAFPQANSHIPSQQQQHAQSQLQQTTAFNHQMQQQQQQQQHLLQQQHQQRMQQQQAQHAQLHRLSQPHTLSSVHQTQTVTQASTGHGAQASVFPNADFFQTLQQTAAALPTVLPYDQSQYIGQLMYFPYPTAAAAAANGLFGTASAGDSQQMSTCSTTPATQTTLINQVSSNASQVIGGASLVSATPGGLVTLNPGSGTANQVQSASHLLNPSASMVGLAGGVTSVGSATQALAPLFTTAHFYQQPQQHSQPSGNQIQLQHNLQHHGHPSFSMQHVHPLSGHSAVHAAQQQQQQQQQQQSTTTMLLQGPVHPSASQLNMTASPASGNQTQPSTPQRHVANTPAGAGKTTATNGDLQKVDDPIHSTPSQTPIKQNEQDILNHDPQSHNSSSNLDVSSSSIKRDNNGTGHFVCGVCGREFGMRCRLIAHTRRHTGERPFPCADCGRAFSDRGNLQRHRYTHSSQPRFHCSVCGKSFRQASCLSNHRRFHCAGASGRPCPFCQRSFRSSSSLQMHIRWKHRADAAAAVAAAAAAAVAVSGSGTSTSSISDAFNHLPGLSYVPTATSINGLSTMSLNGVSSSGQLAGVLSQLVTTNTGSPNKRKWRRKPKPKQNAFGKLDGSTRNILAGINLSEGIDVNAAAAAAGAAAAAVGGPVPLDRKGRPCNFPCPACPRRFAFQCRLAAHLRCHTNVRPFICIDCGRAFTQRGYLVRHAAVHKLDRPFSCELCDRSYKHYGSLVNHRRTHSKLNAATLSNIALLSGTGLDHLGCDGVTGAVTGLSSLEEVVGGALHRTNKSDGSDTLGVTSTSATTITLLPVTKVEEILPGDLGGSLHQVCLPSVACPPGSTMGSVLGMPDGQQQHLETDQSSQNHPHVPLSHQLTATAVWPILTSCSGGTGGLGTVTQTHPTTGQLIQSSIAQSQSMLSGSHFSTLTISPSQPTTHQLSVASTTPQQINTTAVSSVSSAGTPAFVTVPLFSSQSQPGADTTESSSTALSNTHSHHHPFHGASTLVTAGSDSNQQQQQQQQSHHQNVPQTTAQHPQTTHLTASQLPSSDSNTTPVLHVLQPSPSIFFSPYYLPHTAASQM